MHRFILAALLSGASLFAASSVATVSTGGPLTINGKRVPNTAAPTWPLVAGDEVATSTEGAVLTFPDGGRVTLAPNTKVKLAKCGPSVVQMFQGIAEYSSGTDALEFCAVGHPVKPHARTRGKVIVQGTDNVLVEVAGRSQVRVPEGNCSCELPGAAKNGHSLKKPVIIVAAAGAAATGIAIGVTQKPNPSSPKGKAKGQQ